MPSAMTSFDSMSGKTVSGTFISQDFSKLVLEWFDRNGRKDLPWQKQVNPYRVWVSEIMLQQTRVTTVIPYFNDFMMRFPDVNALANSKTDEVLRLWSGLGYYSRARYLHKSAGMILEQYSGKFPDTLGGLMSLPGIGRSTAGAILSIAMNKAAPILDGNVKRVLARYFAIEGWPGNRSVESSLWELAERLLPVHRFGDYTQAMMDIGATLCKRGKPDCGLCPLRSDCAIFQTGQWQQYPAPKPKKQLPVKKTFMLLLSDDAGHFLLRKRQEKGVWQGLWSFPQADSLDALGEIVDKHPGNPVRKWKTQPAFRHTFSHYHLDIIPVTLSGRSEGHTAGDEKGQWYWYRPGSGSMPGGMPAPVRKLLLLYSSHTDCK